MGRILCFACSVSRVNLRPWGQHNMLRLIRRMWMSVHEGLYDAVLLDCSAELSASKQRCWRRRSHFFPALMPKPYSHAFVECCVFKMTLPATHKTLLGCRLAAGTLALMRTTGTCSSLRSGPCHAQSLSLGLFTSTGEGSYELHLLTPGSLRTTSA